MCVSRDKSCLRRLGLVQRRPARGLSSHMRTAPAEQACPGPDFHSSGSAPRADAIQDVARLWTSSDRLPLLSYAVSPLPRKRETWRCGSRSRPASHGAARRPGRRSWTIASRRNVREPNHLCLMLGLRPGAQGTAASRREHVCQHRSLDSERGLATPSPDGRGRELPASRDDHAF